MTTHNVFQSRLAERASTITGYKRTSASFIISGSTLPRVEESLRIGELMRAAIMSKARQHFGENNIPSIFSGHGMPKDNRHGHAFYLPWDSNHDGHIDRVLLHVPAGMQAPEQRVVESVNRLWRRDGGELQLVLESIAGPHINNALTRPGMEWVSVTPYLHPWHCKNRFSVEDQIRRECRERGLPEPQIEPLSHITINSRHRRPIHFHRFRKKSGLVQPDTQGSFWKLTFKEPVQGPLALGFGCHYGLGIFRPNE